MPDAIRKNLLFWLVVLMVFLVMLIASTVISIYRIHSLDQTFYQVGRSSYEMLYNVEEIEQSLRNMETNERGFLLTGNETYLNQLQSARKDISSRFQSLDALIPGGTPLEQQADDTRRSIDIWITQAALPQIAYWQNTYSKQVSQRPFSYLNNTENSLMSASSADIVKLEGAVQRRNDSEINNLVEIQHQALAVVYVSAGLLALYVILLWIIAYRQKEVVQKANGELKEHQRKLEMAVKELQEVSEHKSRFLANVSHELRTPLNSIIGFAQVLQKQFYGPLTDNQGRYVAYVLSSGQHLLGLINDILDLSKVEAGKMELDLSRFSLRTMLENSFIMFNEKVLRQQLQLSLNVSGDVGDITADEHKLKQIMFNLLSNAVKFTPDQGSIQVNARIISFQQDEYIELTVADTGIGIPASEQERIFEPFHQVDGTYTRKNQGTGLGLSLVKRLLELHLGWIGVESEGEGKGSAFHCYLPLGGNEEDGI